MGEQRQGQGNPQQGGQGDKGIEQPRTPSQGDESTRQAQPRQGDKSTQTTQPGTEQQEDTGIERSEDEGNTGGTQQSNR